VWTDFVQMPVPGLRVLMPWILIAAGMVAQLAGARLLMGGARSGKPSLPELTERAASSLSDPGELPRLETPIAGARVPTNPELLPGSRRAYRGGEHQGVDFSCRPGTSVVAAADGWVLSVEDGPDLPESRRTELLSYCKQLGNTPPEVLTVLHGRRVTLCHGMYEGRLLTTSYSHLGSVSPDIVAGCRVRKGDLVGVSGSSGTSHAYRDDGWGELHFEVHLDGVPLGSGMSPQLAGDQYREVLGARVSR